MKQIDRDRARVLAVLRWLDAADDARAAAVGNRDGSRRAAPIEERDDVRLVPWKRDDVGWIRIVASMRADEIAERLAVRVAGSVLGRVGANRSEARGRIEARRSELELF